MVFQKKGPMKGKQQTQSFKSKKPFEEENDDSDMLDDMDSDDGDSSGDEQVQKTPAGKTPKGKQALSDKKVSFQMAGKNTPNSVGKQTPGKMSLLKGMGKNTPVPNKNGNAKKVEGDDDDDDDEEDDDDLDMMLGSDDDEEDDDDDDDDEEDEDDDEPPKNAKQLNQSKNKTPVKNVEKTPAKSAEKAKKGNKTPVQQETSPEKKQQTPGVKKAMLTEAGSRRERDIRTLYIGNLPKDVTPTEIKALSSDILNVSIPTLGPTTMKKRKSVFAFAEFLNEAKAEENYKTLQNKKLRNETLILDFAGEKSKNRQKAADTDSDRLINLKKLYVVSIPAEATMSEVAKFFPKSFQIILTTNPSFRTASVNYLTEKDAAEELEAAKTAAIFGRPITVLYSSGKESRGKKRKDKNRRSPNHPSKRMKFAAKQDDDDADE